MDNTPTHFACPSCGALSPATENFCSRCGAPLKREDRSMSTKKLVIVYLISFFLAPFGLGYAYSYLKKTDPKARRVGIIVIVLTVVAVVLMIWISGVFTHWEYQSINSLGDY